MSTIENLWNLPFLPGWRWHGPIFPIIHFVNVDYQPFDASNWPLTDSGLLGPVTLTLVVHGHTGD
jgi:hypothetical protein